MYQGSTIETVMDDIIRTVEQEGAVADHKYDVHRAISRSLKRNGAMIAWNNIAVPYPIMDEAPGICTKAMPRFVYKILKLLRWVY